MATETWLREQPEWVRVGLFGAVLLSAFAVGLGLRQLVILFANIETTPALVVAIFFAVAGFAWWGMCFWVSMKLFDRLFRPDAEEGNG